MARIEVRPYLESDETAVVGLWKEVFSDVTGRNDPKKDIQRKLAVQRELFLVARAPYVYEFQSDLFEVVVYPLRAARQCQYLP